MKTRDAKIADITDAHGCMTGDCHHGTANDCSTSLREYVHELAENIVDEQAMGEDQKDETNLLRALVLGVWARAIALCCDAAVVADKNYSLGFVMLNIFGYLDKAAELIRRQDKEIEVLRQYGNKDCTTMADEELKRLREEKDGEGT